MLPNPAAGEQQCEHPLKHCCLEQLFAGSRYWPSRMLDTDNTTIYTPQSMDSHSVTPHAFLLSLATYSCKIGRPVTLNSVYTELAV
jgi:hypothetical protein